MFELCFTANVTGRNYGIMVNMVNEHFMLYLHCIIVFMVYLPTMLVL